MCCSHASGACLSSHQDVGIRVSSANLAVRLRASNRNDMVDHRHVLLRARSSLLRYAARTVAVRRSAPRNTYNTQRREVSIHIAHSSPCPRLTVANRSGQLRGSTLQSGSTDSQNFRAHAPEQSRADEHDTRHSHSPPLGPQMAKPLEPQRAGPRGGGLYLQAGAITEGNGPLRRRGSTQDSHRPRRKTKCPASMRFQA